MLAFIGCKYGLNVYNQQLLDASYTAMIIRPMFEPVYPIYSNHYHSGIASNSQILNIFVGFVIQCLTIQIQNSIV